MAPRVPARLTCYDRKGCDAALAGLMPRVGNYDWAWRLLRRRARCNGGWVPERLLSLFRAWAGRSKPYFIGTTAGGLRYLGDVRDMYSVVLAVLPDYDAAVAGFLAARAAARAPAAYVDVGANVGVFTATVARATAGSGYGFAFEPVPATAARAAATVALNSLTNVTVVQAAVSDAEGEITLFTPSNNSSLCSIDPAAAGRRVAGISVSCVTLDGLAAEGVLPQVGVLKIDVEGAEPSVLRGAADLLTRDRPTVLFEYNAPIAARLGWSLDHAVALTAPGGGRGRVSLLRPDGTLEFPVPTRVPAEMVNVLSEPVAAA